MRQALADGVIAGFPVEDVRVTVFDGKTTPVDGKEVAFTTAGRKATMEVIRNSKPIVLEPIVEIEILGPTAPSATLTGDLSGKRGHVTGTGQRGGMTAITGRCRWPSSTTTSPPEIADRRAGQLQPRVSATTRRCRRTQQQLTAHYKAHDDERRFIAPGRFHGSALFVSIPRSRLLKETTMSTSASPPSTRRAVPCSAPALPT